MQLILDFEMQKIIKNFIKVVSRPTFKNKIIKDLVNKIKKKIF